MTEYQKMVVERFCRKGMSVDEGWQVFAVGADPTQFGMEDIMIEYLEQHPNATLEETDAYWMSIRPTAEDCDDYAAEDNTSE